jgi:4-amino-4-deoxy-L-arabinose transferase-like glycosyltransferase
LLLIAAGVLCAGLMVYSQTSAFTGDEGFHLLAAQLIDDGRRPYIDFCFPQTPLNAYWNAAWMRIFGQSWRVPHAVSTLLIMAAVLLSAQFVYTRLPEARNWRVAAALAAMLFIALNPMVVEYGPLAQAYAICLFLMVAAFRLTIVSAGSPYVWAAFGIGLCAGAAAASSLLSATAAPVFLLWLLLYNRAGSLWLKGAGYFVGGAIPFLPVLWLYIQSPRPVIFNLFQYHLSYRTLYWDNATQHDLEIIASWIDSGPALLLILLAVAGALFIRFRSQWEVRLRREFYLCVWLTVGIGIEMCTAHPTFSRYFLLMVPFAAIPATAGLYFAAMSLYKPGRPFWPVAILAFLLAMGLGKSLYQRNNDVRTWADYEQMAKKIDQEAPRDASIFADEEIYFLTRRIPPPGLEFSYSHKLNLAPDLMAQLHIVTQKELDKMAAAGAFAAAATCDDGEADEMDLTSLYRHKTNIDDCGVYWGKVK